MLKYLKLFGKTEKVKTNYFVQEKFFLQKVNQLMLLVAMPQPDATLL